MIFDIELKRVIEMYKKFFEKLDKLKTGNDINKNLERLNKINFLYKTFPVRLKNGDVVYINYDEGNFNYSIKYNNHNERLNIIDKRGIKKVLNSYVRDIDFPSYLLDEDIFKSSSNFNEDFEKVNAEYGLFTKYEENVNSNNDINNNPELESINSTINHLTSSINELRELAYDLQEETWKKEKELYKKDELYDYYSLIVNSTTDYLSEKSHNITEVFWKALGVLYFVGFPIVFTELVTVPDYLLASLAVAAAPFVIKPLSYLSLIPFVPSIRKRLKKKYSNGEIDENTILELKKTIEQNNKDIKELKEKVDELKKARIKLSKISIKKENNYNKEKKNTINNNINLVESTHDLCQELNTVVAMEQSPKVLARVQTH